jgi:branched-chain amino acid transport system substrate-binding protein
MTMGRRKRRASRESGPPRRVAVLAAFGVLALVLAACAPEEPEVVEADVDEPDEPPDDEEPEEVPEAEEGEPYHVGVIVAITGGASSLGIPERNTAEMIAEEVNAAGGIEGPDGLMHPLEVIILDTQSEETHTVLATQRLIEQDQVPVIVGPTQSGTTMAIVDIVQEAEVPLISLAAAAAIIEPVDERQWVFKTPQTDRLVLEVLVDHFQAEGIERVAWMNVATGFGDTGRVEWEPIAEEFGIETVADERFDTGDTDMTAQLTRIAETDADAVLVWAIPPEAAVVARNHAELAMDIPMYQSHGVANRAFIDLAGEGAEAVRFPAGKLLVADQLPDDDPQKDVLVAYADDYTREFEEEPSTFGGHAWDGMWMAIEALGACGEEPACIRDYLETDIVDFVGITGVFTMSPDDHMGLTSDALVLIEIEDGDWALVE